MYNLWVHENYIIYHTQFIIGILPIVIALT